MIDYATAGDTDGEYATSARGYTYNDVEAVIAPKFGDVDIMTANHHGSGHSSSQFYVDTLKPEVSMISCGEKSKHKHPSEETFERLKAASDVYLTNVCDENRDYGGTWTIDGTILVQSTDGYNYTVNDNPYTAIDPLGSVLDVAINEFMPHPADGVEFVELYNFTKQPIEIAGLLIDDQEGRKDPIAIPADTPLLPPGGFYVMEMEKFFPKKGEIRLLTADGRQVIDGYKYRATPKGFSWFKVPDGGDWWPGHSRGRSNSR